MRHPRLGLRRQGMTPREGCGLPSLTRATNTFGAGSAAQYDGDILAAEPKGVRERNVRRGAKRLLRWNRGNISPCASRPMWTGPVRRAPFCFRSQARARAAPPSSFQRAAAPQRAERGHPSAAVRLRSALRPKRFRRAVRCATGMEDVPSRHHRWCRRYSSANLRSRTDANCRCRIGPH